MRWIISDDAQRTTMRSVWSLDFGHEKFYGPRRDRLSALNRGSEILTDSTFGSPYNFRIKLSSVRISGPLVRYKYRTNLLIIITIMKYNWSVTRKTTLALKRSTESLRAIKLFVSRVWTSNWPNCLPLSNNSYNWHEWIWLFSYREPDDHKFKNNGYFEIFKVIFFILSLIWSFKVLVKPHSEWFKETRWSYTQNFVNGEDDHVFFECIFT